MATKTQQSKRPATTLRCGNIKATIWENTSEKGSFFATTFSPRWSQVLQLKICVVRTMGEGLFSPVYLPLLA
jgi:hypothetical protein